jgi:hypothetical protein
MSAFEKQTKILNRLDGDFQRLYGWVLPKAAEPETANPPSASNLYNLSFPSGNRTLIQKIESEILEQNPPKKLVAW